MSLASRRNFLIDELIKLAKVDRSFLRKFTIPTLASMLEELKNKYRDDKGLDVIKKEFEELKASYESGNYILVGKHHHLDAELQLIKDPQWSNIVGYFFVEDFRLINKKHEEILNAYLENKKAPIQRYISYNEHPYFWENYDFQDWLGNYDEEDEYRLKVQQEEN